VLEVVPDMLGASAEAITGRLGVGAIAFLACFLVADGQQIGIFEMVESYGKSASFGIVIALPTAVVTYVLGVIMMGLADLIYRPFSSLAPITARQVRVVSMRGGALLQQIFVENLRNFELLKGASAAFVLLAVGCLAEISNMPSRAIIAASVVGSVALAMLSLMFAVRARSRAVLLSAEAELVDT
jgi:hypothetical protein